MEACDLIGHSFCCAECSSVLSVTTVPHPVLLTINAGNQNQVNLSNQKTNALTGGAVDHTQALHVGLITLTISFLTNDLSSMVSRNLHRQARFNYIVFVITRLDNELVHNPY